jgi:polyisoprenyl-teichoic acid--peptidoglycan teichoic acid transferase
MAERKEEQREEKQEQKQEKKQKKEKRGKKLTAEQANKRTVRNVVIVAVLFFVLIIGLPGAAIFSRVNKVKKVKKTEDVVTPDQEDFEEDETDGESSSMDIQWGEISPLLDDDLINIMLVGQDRREGESRQRSDSMILCSINPETKKVSLISFMRDLYVQIPNGYSDNRLNAAYAFGGFSLLSDTIYTNFGITIDGSLEVDFNGFEKVIDTLDGVDIQLTAQEAEIVGDGAVEGTNHLNGKQTLTYARIRKIDNDFNRTQRQRNVLQAIYQKFQGASASEMLKVVDQLLPYMSTDMSNSEILLLAAKLLPGLGSYQISSYRIPADGTYQSANIHRMSVLVPDLEKTREILEKEYLPITNE